MPVVEVEAEERSRRSPFLDFGLLIEGDRTDDPEEKLCLNSCLVLGEDVKRFARIGLSSEALRLAGDRLLRVPFAKVLFDFLLGV